MKLLLPHAVEVKPDEPKEDALPISWSTSASTWSARLGQEFLLECPPKGSIGVVWGTKTYTSDSKICTAGVHSGLISPAEGGVVRIRITTGEDNYFGSKKHGVQTSSYGGYGSSFVFVK